MQTFHLNTIGTHLEIRIPSEKDASFAFSRIEKYLGEFEEKYSRFRENNWLAQLNRDRTWVLDSDGKKMIQAMLEVARATDGYFDPTIWKRLAELWYGTNNDTIWKKDENYSKIVLSENTIELQWDIEIEFGWIGKGYLLDILYDQLILAGYDEFLINFWWDLSARGEWKIWLENPFNLDEIIGVKILSDGCLACSAGTKRKWWNHHHLINPQTGESGNEVIASYIEGMNGARCDMYATTLCVMPWELAQKTLKETEWIQWVIVRHDGALYQTEKSQIELFRE